MKFYFVFWCVMNNRFKALRKALKLKQDEIAKILNKSTRMIQYYEQGKFDIETDLLFKLHELYDVNLNWLISGTGNMFNNVQNISFNGELLELVVETVEEIFISNQLSLSPSKKAKLIRLLYEYMDKQVIEDRNDGKIIKLQDYFNTKYKNHIINMVSSL